MSQVLTDWDGDVASLIVEMKRRAGVRTDQELARYIGAAQSTVANWRNRGRVPESAILQFEKIAADPHGSRYQRNLAARTVALRLPELYYHRLGSQKPSVSRFIPYAAISYSLNAIIAEIERQMEALEKQHGLTTQQLASMLIEDERFLQGVLDWIGKASMGEMLTREVDATARALKP